MFCYRSYGIAETDVPEMYPLRCAPASKRRPGNAREL